MRAVADLVFAYGTLMRGFPLHRLIAGRSEFVGPGTVNGLLLDLGDYPGAVPDGSATVHGEVYRLLSSRLVATLDREEGYRPDAPSASLYVRRRAAVRMTDGREVTAWTYWYNGPRGRATPIPDGDYRRHCSTRISLR